MNEQQLDKWFKTLSDGLTTLMGKMQMSAEKLFEWGMKANYASALSDALFIVFSVVFIYATYKYLFWGIFVGRLEIKHEYAYNPDRNYVEVKRFHGSDALAAIAVAASVLSFPLGIFSIMSTHYLIMRLVSPEIMTLRDFAGMVK